MPLIVLLNRYSVVLVIPQNNRRSTARFVRHTCGNLKRGSETLNSKLAALAPVTVFGLYVSGFGLNGRVFVLSIWSKPVSRPVWPIWFDTHTYGGGPVKTPVPSRTCVLCLPPTSQFIAARGDQRNFGSGRWPLEYLTAAPCSSRNVRASTAGLGNVVFANCAVSNRTPAVTVMSCRTRYSSWA